MRKGRKHTFAKATAVLLVLVMAMLTFNQSANIHTHILNDGTIVSHAHPFQKTNNKAPVQSHSHSLKEFTFLSHLGFLFTCLFVTLAITLFSVKYRKFIPIQTYHDQRTLRLTLGRAPPFL